MRIDKTNWQAAWREIIASMSVPTLTKEVLEKAKDKDVVAAVGDIEIASADELAA